MEKDSLPFSMDECLNSFKSLLNLTNNDSRSGSQENSNETVMENPEKSNSEDDIENLRQDVLYLEEIFNGKEIYGAPKFSSFQRFNALYYFNKNKQLECIYHLVDSHAPQTRLKACFKYQLMAEEAKGEIKKERLKFKWNLMAFEKPFTNVEENLKKVLGYIEEMPKEWTVVQLTPQYNPAEGLLFNLSKLSMGSVHLTVFNCGKNQYKPFTVLIDPPTSKSNEKIEILQNIQAALASYKATLSSFRPNGAHNIRTKTKLKKELAEYNRNLMNCIKDIQNAWFGEWRCLFIGKYEDTRIEDGLVKASRGFVKKLALEEEMQPETECLLYYITKGSPYLTTEEIRRALQHCFPNASSVCLKTVYDFIMSVQDKYSLKTAARHPVILIVDDVWENLPYEMMDVFAANSCTRLPSLHFLYMLFKEYEGEIVNGYKIIKDHNSGCYVVNPDANLDGTEKRMMSFINYWTPKWIGVTGCAPTCEEFFEFLHSSSIFCYCGHGNGSRYLDERDLHKSWMRSVVFLFGCSSVSVNRSGIEAQPSGMYNEYLIANCPCVVGFLWLVPDRQTDLLNTNLFSTWLPSDAATHWKHVNLQAWLLDGEMSFTKVDNKEKIKHEPKLLVALAKVKSSTSVIDSISACVVRGLPVKLEN